MRILVYNWRCWFNPNAGGAEVFTHEVLKRWARSGHEITLFASEYPRCEHEETVEGVKIVRSGGRFSVYRKARDLYRRRFAAEAFDVVVDEINTRPFFASSFVDNGESVVALIHQLAREYWFYETPFPISYLGRYFLEDRWLRRCIELPIVTVSESTRKDLLDLGFRRISLVPEGLNFDPSEGIPEKEQFPVIVYAGRLRRAKRPDHAIKAFRIVREKMPNAQLWILGDGPLGKGLQKTAEKGIRFFGSLPNAKRRKVIERGWVLVNPSVREGWGLNVVEANALGVPCVAYDVAGLRDSIKHGKTGLLVPSGDVNTLAEVLAGILKDEDSLLEFSRNALDYSRGFSWDATADEFMEVLKNVVRRQ